MLNSVEVIVLGAKLVKASVLSGAWYVLEGEETQGHLQAMATFSGSGTDEAEHLFQDWMEQEEYSYKLVCFQ